MLQRELSEYMWMNPCDSDFLTARLVGSVRRNWSPKWPEVKYYWAKPTFERHELIWLAQGAAAEAFSYLIRSLDDIDGVRRYYGSGDRHRSLASFRLGCVLQYHRLYPDESHPAARFLALTSKRVAYGSLPGGSVSTLGWP